MRVLIVDDNATNIMVIQEMLRRAGYEKISAAHSAEEMFRILRTPGIIDPFRPPKIDLILLDIMMPAMDGIEACRLIQADDKLRDIPVIMVTAIGDSHKLAEALDAGAIDFVTKPINKTELLARIRSALRLKRELDWHKERDRRLKEELNLARQVQEAVLPDPIESGRIRASAFFRASKELAGDLYAWHQIDEHRWAFAVVDAMGHGISSSLVSMFVASVLKESMRTLWSPERVLRELNRRVLGLQCDNELLQYYCTGIYVSVDLQRGRLEYVNAGHPPGLLFRPGAAEPERLGVTAPPIGMFEALNAAPRSVEWRGGDRLFLYTDGILDPFQGDGEEQIGQLVRFLERAQRDDERLEQPLCWQSEDGRADDRCLVRVETRQGEVRG